MKWCVLAAVVLVSFPFHANAASDWDELFIYSDAALTQSSLDDNAPRTVTLYVAGCLFGSDGVRFSTEASPEFTGVWLGDSSPYVTIGQSPTDISIGFGTCITSPSIVILTVSYQLFGTSASCSEIGVAPPDGFPTAISSSTGCAFAEVPVRTESSIRVNCPVATESTTWGKVKALFRN